MDKVHKLVWICYLIGQTGFLFEPYILLCFIYSYFLFLLPNFFYHSMFLSLHSPGSCKTMVGNPDGFTEKVKMGLTDTWVATGKHERKDSGMVAQMYLAN